MTEQMINKIEDFEGKLDRLLNALHPQQPTTNPSISPEEDQFLNKIVLRFFYER